ncbi:molecular chaperone TorD [Slackia faecicanis]|uniref:Molecular chaperone TorD n=1 Tax=Slackia faecicanis TaxID=255723 RepID=A0A3N0AGQ1_9ACTN|nr:molecular chaperone TorD family protein [Slackia faecicanis]RNL21299.1 molecular chaperone TorD [Slackia faecicanis]
MACFSTEELASVGVAFDFAARLVQVEPGRAWIESCIDDDLFAAAPFGQDDEAVANGLALMRQWCAGAAGDVDEAVGSLQREWLRLFVGLGAPEASINESYYTEPNSIMFGQSTLSARAAYRAWGLESDRKASEPDDALGIMLAFCAHLVRESLRLGESGDEEASRKPLKAFEDFLVQHMLPWLSAWRYLVKQHAKTDYYRGVGELVFGLERSCAARFGIAFDEGNGSFSYNHRL